MNCKLCHTNETNSTNGICWECFNFTSPSRLFTGDKYPYPKIDEDNDWRKKLTIRNIIQTLFDDGFSVKQMAIIFNVSNHAIRNYLLPPEIIREKRIQEPSYGKDYGNPQKRAYAKRTRRRVLIGEMLPYEATQRRNKRRKQN